MAIGQLWKLFVAVRHLRVSGRQIAVILHLSKVYRNCTDEWRDIKALGYTSYLRAHQCSETDQGRSVDVPDRIKDSVLSKVSDNHGAHLLSEDKPISKQLEGFSIY